MKKALLALAVAGAAVSAQADTKLYGHVAYNIQDRDSDEDINFSRHAFSESRFGISFSKKLKNGLKAIAIQEYGLGNGDGGNESSNTGLGIRRNAFGFSGSFGKVLLGQYNDVGDGVLNADLAGTGLITALASNSFGAVAGIGVNGFDPGRGEALRYYSPKLGGIATVGVQLQEGGGNEIALKLNTNGFRFNAFVEDNGDAGAGAGEGVESYDSANGFLVGYKIAGFSLTYTQSTRETNAGADLEQSGFKVGYATGKHKVSLSKTTRDDDGSTAEPESTGVQYLYNMAKGVQLWAAYQDVDFDVVGTDDVDGISIGGRVKF